MKKIFVLMPSILLIFILSSCNSSEKKNEKQASDTSIVNTDQPAGNSNEPNNSSRVNSTEKEQNAGNRDDDTMTGQELVTKVTNQLIEKLNLVDKQQTDVKDILEKTFLGMGEDLNANYTKEKARAVHMDVIKKSFDQILPILNENQRERFNRFHQHLK